MKLQVSARTCPNSRSMPRRAQRSAREWLTGSSTDIRGAAGQLTGSSSPVDRLNELPLGSNQLGPQLIAVEQPL
jgi:hypothetical protein